MGLMTTENRQLAFVLSIQVLLSRREGRRYHLNKSERRRVLYVVRGYILG